MWQIHIDVDLDVGLAYGSCDPGFDSHYVQMFFFRVWGGGEIFPWKPKIVRCYCTKSKELITLASAVLPVLPGALICLKTAIWGKELLFYHFLHYFGLILQVCHQQG